MFGASKLLGRIVVAVAATGALLLGSVGTAAAADNRAQAAPGFVVSRFTVYVLTGNQSYAGTDATVHLKVYGCDGTFADWVNLDNSQNNFEVGKFDSFGSFNWDLNGVCTITLAKYANGSDWQMVYTNIYDEVTGQTWHCPALNASDGYFGSGRVHKSFACRAL